MKRLEETLTAVRAVLDDELAQVRDCLAALGPARAGTARRPARRRSPALTPPPPQKSAPRAPRGPRELKVKPTPKRRAGTPRVKDGRCDVCGRADIDRGTGGVIPFHYAPEPCGLVCAGGASIGKPEDRVDGIHSRRNCPKCSKEAPEP